MGTPANVEKEINRADAIAKVSSVLVDTAKAETNFIIAATNGRMNKGSSFIPLSDGNGI